MATQKPCKWAVREAHQSSCQMRSPIIIYGHNWPPCFLRQWLRTDGSDDDSAQLSPAIRKPSEGKAGRRRREGESFACITGEERAVLNDAEWLLSCTEWAASRRRWKLQTNRFVSFSAVWRFKSSFGAKLLPKSWSRCLFFPQPSAINSLQKKKNTNLNYGEHNPAFLFVSSVFISAFFSFFLAWLAQTILVHFPLHFKKLNRCGSGNTRKLDSKH